jgi:hypothetical protein
MTSIASISFGAGESGVANRVSRTWNSVTSSGFTQTRNPHADGS